MLIFIVPLQSPQASNSWPHICALARRTLNSLLRQLHSELRIILACNEPPSILPVDPRLIVLPCTLPVPERNTEARTIDKFLKVRAALLHIREMAPCHVMVVDADDLVSNRLAGISAANLHSNGWVFDSGWMHDEGSKLVFIRRHKFFEVCGTSNIVRLERADLPTTEKGSWDDTVFCRSGHSQIKLNMEKLGRPLSVLPFPGAIYMLATGENDSGFSLRNWRSKQILLKKLLCYRLLTGRICREFGLNENILHPTSFRKSSA